VNEQLLTGQQKAHFLAHLVYEPTSIIGGEENALISSTARWKIPGFIAPTAPSGGDAWFYVVSYVVIIADNFLSLFIRVWNSVLHDSGSGKIPRENRGTGNQD